MLLIYVSFFLFSLFSPHNGNHHKQELDAKIEQLMSEYSIPGLQLAVMKDDSILISSSYGYANKESGILVSDSSLFRVASLSKPITAITLLKLAETGKLNLDKTVFGVGGILTDDFKEVAYGDRVKKITVRHLLQHKSGWTNKPDDPMFWSRELTQKQIISKILETRPPEYEPGTKEVYSNFGYCILGRVIEKVTGISYEQYVKDSVLFQCGIEKAYIGGDRPDERLTEEVMYYSEETTGAYDMAIRRMDAHGGWLLSANGLLSFLAKIDRNTGVNDFISPEMLEGTYFNFPRWIHTGSLPGTMAIVSRVDDHYGYAVLINTRHTNQNDIFKKVQDIMISIR